MAKKKPSTKPKENKNNNAAASGTETNKSEPSPKSPVSAVSISSILVAFLAFGVGILSPPLLKMIQTQRESSTTSPHLESKIRSMMANMTQDTQQSFPCNEENLANFLHDTYVPGLYVVCFNKVGENGMSVGFYKGATRSRYSEIELDGGAQLGWTALRSEFEETLPLKPIKEGMQPWAMFTPRGERIADAESVDSTAVGEALAQLGMGLVYQGGQFIWPGVKLGFERKISLYSVMPMGSPKFERDQNVTLETLSLVPLVLSVKGFLTETECDHIQEIATPSMEYSGVVLMDHDRGKKASDFRTSQTTFVGPVDDTFVDIDYRTASLVRIPRTHQEHVQVLRYGEAQYYQAHHDFFTPEHYKQDPDTLRNIKHGIRNRLATVFWYLSDVEEGGETAFPRFNRGREKSFDDCETGLLVKPEKGKVIIFYSMTADGLTDQYSLHGACPVKEGIKWAANKWVWNERMFYTPP